MQFHTKSNSLDSIFSHSFLKTDLTIFRMIIESEIEAGRNKKQCDKMHYKSTKLYLQIAKLALDHSKKNISFLKRDNNLSQESHKF